MHPGVVACQADATLTDVARLMATHHVHCIATMDIARQERGEKLIWSLVTDQDIVRGAVSRGPEPAVSTIASAPILSVAPDTQLSSAAELMLSHAQTHLLVVDAETQRPIGVLSTADIVGIVAWGEA
jgi:CBS domain-containing protein